MRQTARYNQSISAKYSSTKSNYLWIVALYMLAYRLEKGVWVISRTSGARETQS